MKSQDIVVLLRLVSLHQKLREADLLRARTNEPASVEWQGWDDIPDEHEGPPVHIMADEFSVRGLEASLGISKSEVNASIKRSMRAGLALKARKTGYPKANIPNLIEFICHGLKYVFPAEPGAMVRGIPTGVAAPVLQGELISASEYICVWPDPMGKEMGQSLAPLYKSVPHGVRRDAELYAYLALVDAIRLGNPREAKLAQQLLEERLKS